jgi:AcrR family transcriptional regulator
VQRRPAQQQAADTRRRITTAALGLFTEHGFSGTTVAAIATAAGVAPQTVYATFGSKGEILHALLAQMEHDAGAESWRDRISAEVDPRRKLEAFASWSATMFSTNKAAIAAAHGAGSDPAIAEVKADADRHRREALASLVDEMGRSGALRAGLSPGRAVDRAWMLTGVELYLAATDACDWSDTDYADWLAGLLAHQLLGDHGEAPAGPLSAT